MTHYGLSPFRYPGGKGSLSHFISEIIQLNKLNGGTYLELYAGGAAVALSLIQNNLVKNAIINDADYRVFACWHSILFDTNRFIRLIDKTEINICEWKNQRSIYEEGKISDILKLGFATFFLNRTNRSGILHNAGPIGGIDQTGNYLIDARFNKENLKYRIKKISEKKDRIKLFNLTAESFLTSQKTVPKKSFFYLDPPYYNKGRDLYLNNYSHEQHDQLSRLVMQSENVKNWVISYDNVLQVRKMYPGYRKSTFTFNYSLQAKKTAKELLIFSNNILIPKNIIVRGRKSKLLLR